MGTARQSIPLIDMIPDTRQAVEYLIAPFFQAAAVELGLFSTLRAQISGNMRKLDKTGDTMPMDTKLGPIEAIEQYLYENGNARYKYIPVDWRDRYIIADARPPYSNNCWKPGASKPVQGHLPVAYAD